MLWNNSGDPGLPTRPVLPHFLVLERVFRILLKCLTLLTGVTAGHVVHGEWACAPVCINMASVNFTL